LPPTQLITLTASEEDLASVILKQRKISLSESVPQDIEPRECLANIKSCTSALKKLGGATRLIGAYLGQHMAIMAKRPEIYEAAGYSSLDAYEKAEILDKIGHGTVWNYKLIAERFPNLELGRISKIRTDNLLTAAKICKDASDSQKSKILDKAEELPVEEFREWVEQKSGLSGKGETTGATFPLMGSTAEITELKEWLADSGLIEWAGTDKPVGIILAAIQSATSEFTSPAKEPEVIQTGQTPAGEW
jgi:hypothetical protein